MMAISFPFSFNRDKENICSCKATRDVELSEIEQIIEQINSKELTDSALIACSYHQIALYHYSYEAYLLSIKYNQFAKDIRQEIDDGFLWKSHQNIGYAYYELSQYKSAISYLKKALDTEGLKTNNYIVKIHTFISECYIELGDFYTAIDFAKEALQSNGDDSIMDEARTILAQALIETKDTSNIYQAIDISKKVVDNYTLNKDDFNLQLALDNLGKAYDAIQAYDIALNYYEIFIDKLNGLETEIDQKPIVINNIAAILQAQKKHSKAIETLYHSLAIKKNYYKNIFEYDYAANYENLADNYVALHEFDSALMFYQKALINLSSNFRNEKIFQNPKPKNKELFIYSNLDMIRVLHLKAAASFKYYAQNRDEKYLNLANNTYQTAFDFHDQLQKDISTENSRLFQAKNIVPYIENALKITFELQEKGQSVGEAAFRFMEKNKATVLLQSINESEALQFANLPDSLLQQEKDLKIAISHHKRKLDNAIYYEDSAVINQLEQTIFDTNLSYQNLIDELEKNHPEYYRLKYRQNQTKLTDVQNQLDDQTALLSYFVGVQSIFVLLILKDSAQLFKVKKPAEWSDVIKDFRDVITLNSQVAKANPYSNKLFDQFVDNAQNLYKCLLKEPLKTINNIPHIKIIPDAELNYIPFDVLLTDKNKTESINYKTLPYLLKQKTISYNYSATLMMEQGGESNTKKNYAYGGYAAQYSDMDSVDIDLPKVRQLVGDMSKFFKGKSYLNKEASKSYFLKDSFTYQILHLAMHGKLNDRYPLNSHLVFTKNIQDSLGIPKDNFQLYAADLYNLQLKTDLAVLNACQTGTGILQKGEGVMSLSRAFTYAGCSSLVMSLWSIPEKSSVNVLQNFFQNIKRGASKDVALREAKLNYLDNASTTISHPIYWAGLALSGNEEAMNFENTSNKFWWTLVLLLVLIGGFLVVRHLKIGGFTQI